MSEKFPMIELEPSESWNLLGQQELGRVVTKVRDVIDIFPVNYIRDGESVVFRTAEGTKLFGLTVSDIVLFEVDSHTEAEAWSVILRGHASVVRDEEEIARLETLGLEPWLPTVKQNWVRVVADQITGRRFHRGPEPIPEPDAS